MSGDQRRDLHKTGAVEGPQQSQYGSKMTMTVMKKCQAYGPSTRQHGSMQEGIVKTDREIKIGDRIKDPNYSLNTDGQNKGHQESKEYL